MAEENIAVVRAALEAWNAFMRGELSTEGYAERFHRQPVLVWSNDRIYPDTPQRLSGQNDVIAFAERFRDGWDALRQEALQITELPDGRVLALIRQSGRGRESGVPISIHFFELCTIRDGKLSRIEYFRHRVDALEAAGLGE